MSRAPSIYLEEIPCAADVIADYLSGLDYQRFLSDRTSQDAVLRNLALIGKAVKGLPTEHLYARGLVRAHRITSDPIRTLP